MSRFDNRRLSAAICAVFMSFIFLAGSGQAQTTIVLDSPDSESIDTAIRAGAHSATNLDGGDLATRASSNADNHWRALLKFDTETRIPRNATIRSATLTLTVSGGRSATRTLSAYRLRTSFDEEIATWRTRKSGYAWATAGGDLGNRYATASATNAIGSRVSFNVTTLVQEIVNATFESSRWTRIAIVDTGSSNDESGKSFFSSEDPDPAMRPVLTVEYGSSTTSGSGGTTSGSGGTSATLKLLHWNVHHAGIRTDGRADLPGLVTWIAKFNADVISLNEVDSAANASAIISRLRSLTGRAWYYHYDYGIVIASRFPIESKSSCVINSGIGRKALQAGIVLNGRTINVFSAHLDAYSATTRQSEARALVACANRFSEQRIIAGDLNAGSSSTEINYIKTYYIDAWPAAKALGTATNYTGNCDGCTRNGRIDYVMASRGASRLVLKAARIFDTRDSDGDMPSDHKPLMVTYAVN
jgi:endonuclease/exonuclease/phosphatase family metal-dependent hydrolase